MSSNFCRSSSMEDWWVDGAGLLEYSFLCFLVPLGQLAALRRWLLRAMYLQFAQRRFEVCSGSEDVLFPHSFAQLCTFSSRYLYLGILWSRGGI